MSFTRMSGEGSTPPFLERRASCVFRPERCCDSIFTRNLPPPHPASLILASASILKPALGGACNEPKAISSVESKKNR